MSRDNRAYASIFDLGVSILGNTINTLRSTKQEALFDFFNSFDIPAYPDTAVPDDCEFPYITYEVYTGDWMNGEIGLTVNIWYYTTDEAGPNAKERQMSEAIKYGNPIPCEGGHIWFKKGTPWCQNLTDGSDPMIKRRYINVTVEYLTEN